MRYRHKKRGTEYTLIGVGRAQGELQDEDPVVLYRGDDGGLWVRHQVEFCDGRFEQVSALATREEAPAEAGAQETLRVLLDNLVIAQSLSKELRQRATDEARSYLYALRAQPPAREDAQPVGWLRAVDEEMVCAHLGVADAEDSFETAKKKLASLIQWNIAVATDPSVGGYTAPSSLAGGEDSAFKVATDLHAAYEALIYGLPKYLEAENLTDEENMIREAWITLDVTAHRLVALATREEAPACEMCNGRGEVGGPTGQTPESFDYVTERCPDCGGTGKLEAPAREDALRVAVEALEKIKAVRVCKESANIWTGADACRKIATAALAAREEAPAEAAPACSEIPLSNHMRVTLEYDPDGSRTATLWNEANEPIADGEAPALTPQLQARSGDGK
ncbi:MAG TPA: hypothetical protein DEB60_09780 [Brevundimonas sp.]|nr:hypothetical protein [Brevundimonas sp.]